MCLRMHVPAHEHEHIHLRSKILNNPKTRLGENLEETVFLTFSVPSTHSQRLHQLPNGEGPREEVYM